MRKVAKVFRNMLVILMVIGIGGLIFLHFFFKPPSNKKLIKKLSRDYTNVKLYTNTYKNNNYRVVELQQNRDSKLPIVIFVHGSPGGILNYEYYLTNKVLNREANLVAYERIGYGKENPGNILHKIADKVAVLRQVVGNSNPNNVVLVGYSYGGPIILAARGDYMAKIAIAPAVKAAYEPKFWALKLYEWPLTRWMVPKPLQGAVKEKYAHLTDLPKYEDSYVKSNLPVTAIQGTADFIVPFKNSKFLQRQFADKPFELIALDGVGHGLLWTQEDIILQTILNQLNR